MIGGSQQKDTGRVGLTTEANRAMSPKPPSPNPQSADYYPT